MAKVNFLNQAESAELFGNAPSIRKPENEGTLFRE